MTEAVEACTFGGRHEPVGVGAVESEPASLSGAAARAAAGRLVAVGCVGEKGGRGFSARGLGG